MHGLLQDLRYALRLLAKQPLYTAVAVLTMALGVGATTAIFDVVHSVLLDPLSYPDSDRLVEMFGAVPTEGIERTGVSPPNFLDFRARLKSFSGLAGFTYFGLSLNQDGRPREITTLRVSPELFDVLGEPAALGRTFRADDDPEAHLVVLSWGIWKRELGGDPAVVGRTITLEEVPWTVLGVMPQGFIPPAEGAELFIPCKEMWGAAGGGAGGAEAVSRSSHYYFVLGRLASGVSLAAAGEEAAAAARALAAEYPEANAGRTARLVPLKEVVVGDIAPVLFTVQGAVLLVLLIAGVNVANLTLARGTHRRHEIAARAALGASRARLVRLPLVEGSLLAVAGGGLGLLLATWGVDLLVAASPPDLPRLGEIHLGWPVFAFASLLVLASGPLIGLLPALQLSRVRVAAAMAGAERGAVGGRGSARARSLLTVAELALSLVLLLGAGLLLKSLARVDSLDLGFDPDRTLAVQLFVYGPRYEEPSGQRGFFDQLFTEVRALPGVEAVGATNALPLSPMSYGSLALQVEGRAEPEKDLAGYRIVTPGYFAAMGRRLVAGRTIGSEDRPDGRPVVLLNETAARRYFPADQALGKRLRRKGKEWATVVGVVADARHQDLESPPAPEVFFPFAQDTTGTMSVVVRTAGDPAALVEAVERKVWQVDPIQPVWRAFTLADSVATANARRRFYTFLVGLFAVVAVALAAVGIYGVISYSVARRTREIGVRMVLGARTETILGMVLREGALLLAAGVGLGLVLGRFALGLAQSLLFEVRATDPSTLVWTSLALAAVALGACALPARRAAAVPPNEALRQG